VGAATRDHGAADGHFTDQAGLPGSHIDKVAELEEAAFASSVDVVVTSPPYNLGIDYNSHDDTAPRAEGRGSGN